MKEILLTRGLKTQVDDEDYESLNKYKWFAMPSGDGFYAARMSRNINNKRITIYMHKVLLKIPNTSKLEGDHKDHNKLNNQKHNIRRATRSQNMINCFQQNTSGYRGVYYHIRDKKFAAQIKINGKVKFLGYFDNPIDAAEKYDRYALKYNGEFAILNFI